MQNSYFPKLNYEPKSKYRLIQPQVPLRLPCYDFAPVTNLALEFPFEKTSDQTNSHGVTGGVYKTRWRIHRGFIIHDY